MEIPAFIIVAAPDPTAGKRRSWAPALRRRHVRAQDIPGQVGDVVDVTVEAVASKGDGIAKKDGFVVFVKDAKQGQTVNVKITDVRARFAIGELTSETPSAPAAAAAPAPEQPSPEEPSDEEE